MSEREAQELLDELDLGSAAGSGRRTGGSLEMEIVRPLTEQDVPTLLAPPPVKAPGQRLAELRSQHHQLARLIARGTAHEDAALMTGYSVSYISVLLGDPTFQNLITHYSTIEDIVQIDVLERMRSLHIASMEELQSRLEREPEGWSKRELMELADMMGKPTLAVVQAKAQSKFAPAAEGGVNIGITFVTPQGVQSAGASAEVIDVESSDVK